MNKTDAFYYMKFYIKFKYILLLTCLSISIISKASDFEVDGLGYNRLSNNQIKTNNENIISFEDANVKAICVANWDKNDDGELSEDEAAAVTYLGGVFYENTTITSFEEFQFFVGIEDLSSAFRNCSNLKKVLIPSSVKTIGKWAFQNCSALTGTLVIPSSVTSIGESAFEECSGFTGALTIPESVTSIGERAFLGCVGFNGSLSLPNSLTSIGKHAFYGCSGFTGNLTIPESVTSIGGWAFQDCSSFTGTLTIPNSVTSIGYAAFWGCSNINKVISQIQNPFPIDVDVFRGISPDAILQVPDGTKAQYIEYSGWTEHFKDIIEEGDNIITYSLSISSTGNGSASFGDSTIKNQTSTFTVNEGLSATITFSPDSGNKIKSVKVNDTDVTSSVSSNEYTISNITADTSVEVEFEAITHTLSIKASGNGSASYSGSTIKNKTSTFTVNEGSPATITFSPDSGNKIKSVKVNSSDVTSSISDNEYTISNITADTSVEVEFEPITYTLSIKASGNGSASYSGSTIKNKTSTFTVNEGSSATITFSPDSGNKIKSVKVNDTDVTSSVSDNEYTISNITADTSVEVEFEPITYTLSIKASGNGSASYSGSTIKNQTSTFTVNEGSSATITFSPDTGNKIKSVKVNDTDVTSSVSSNQYTISSITGNTNVEVEFEPITYTLSIKASGNGSASYSGSTIKNKTSTFTVDEGASATITFSPESGNKIKSVKVNDTDVTSSVSSNQYTISSITGNTNVEVEFEPITYTLSIKASGNGSASYSGSTIKNKTSTFTVNEGSSATITFSPDTGNKIKSVKVNSTDVTSSVYSNEYTINSITDDTDVEVEFEAITYTLSVKATGSGAASYDGTTVRDKTSTFTVNEGTAVSISIYPDNGYRIKSVKENDTDVTSYVSDGIYTINSISRDTEIEVEFEAIPATTYSLSIKATGNGSASYDGNTIRNTTNTFTVNEGASAKITFSPDSGYRIKSVRVNSADVTSSVSGNQYTISNIASDTSVDVEFEAIPATTYTLSIKATGNGSASYDGNTIRNTTKTFTVNDGASATISFSSDDGYRIKTVKVNDVDMTSSVSSSQYTINSISADTNVEVEFEAIPATTYSLSIMATGNGTVTYDGNTIRNTTSTFTVNEGTSVKIAFSPDSGYRIKGVKVNGTDVTSSVSGNQYTISNIASDTSVEVEFEAIPVNTYTLNIVVAGNGSATYNDTDVRNGSETFTVNEGSTITVVFSPDNGNRLNTVKMNGTDVTSQVSGNSYTINNIAANTDLEVTFKEDVNALTVDGVNYSVVSQSDKTVNVVGGNYGKVLTVPATVTSNGTTWKVVGVEADALNGNTELAAIIWNPEVAFTAAVSNPNLLLYVKAEEYAPAAIQNVVVNGTASKIVLKEAGSGNGFYCPQAFTAQQISYTHNYQMQTGIGESKGWETIALPFDVQTITHETKGTIVPFTQWNNESDKKPFWLMELTGTGFVETNEIKAYTPYIISMPNHPQYDSRWLLNGRVTFAASGVTVGKTENLNQPTFNDRTFVPCFADMGSDMGIYALNVNNDFETNNSGMTEGSKFVLNMRRVHPFEAYMTSSSSAPCYAIGVFECMTTGIQQMIDGRWSKEDVVYDLQGRRVEHPSKKGVYMMNGKKMIIK